MPAPNITLHFGQDRFRAARAGTVVAVRHAGDGALDELGPLLEALRSLDGLREKSRGTFYRKSRAFLHFHEDPSGLYADVRLLGDFERVRVTTPAEQRALLEQVRRALADG
jgi:hypothetical protein